MSRLILHFAALLALTALALTGCGGTPAVKEGTLERIQREGKIRVGFANEAPYAYLDPASGRLTGEAPEVLRKVMQELGVKEVEGVLTEFASLIPGLNAGRFDLIAAGMYITPKRCEQALFTNPTYSVGEAFAVQAGNPKGLHSYEDVANSDSAKLGVVSGTVEIGYAKDMGVPENRVLIFPDAPSAVAGVRAGRVDAYAGTALTVQDLLGKAGDSRLERAEPFTDPVIGGVEQRGYGAYVLRKPDARLADAINAALAKFIGTPEHLELVRPFGFTEHELPRGKSAEELCAP